jgi:hypothetical protein
LFPSIPLPLAKREKTSQAFRDALSDRYKSSRATRKRKRTEDKQSQQAMNLPFPSIHHLISNNLTLPYDENLHRRLPTLSRDDFNPSTSVTMPSNQQNVMFSSLRCPISNVSLPSTHLSQSEPVLHLQSSEQYTPSSTLIQNLNMALHDQSIRFRTMNDNFSEWGNINPGHIDPSERNYATASHSNFHLTHTQPHQQINFDPFIASNSLLANTIPQQQMNFNSQATSIPTTRNNISSVDIDRIRNYPEFSTFDLSTLEPTPITENDNNNDQQNPLFEKDTKPMAKR